MDKQFVDRELNSSTIGEYDENGFFYTPNGSFWDPDGVYFSKDGVDKHGGYYDENIEYIPGPGWVEELMCYDDEKDTIIKNTYQGGRGHGKKGYGDADEGDIEEDPFEEVYDEVDYGKLMKEEEEKKQEIQQPKHVFKPHLQQQLQQQKKETPSETKTETISSEMLFSKIPENKIPQQQTSNTDQQQQVRKENKIEVDSLFN
jgi:hypothetical protein